jgi:hypothetical protein
MALIISLLINCKLVRTPPTVSKNAEVSSWCVCVCVCMFLASGYEMGTVMHEIPISSPPSWWHPFHALGLSSTTHLVPPRGGCSHETVQQVRSNSVIELRGSCWWAAPQPRLRPRHNIARVCEGRQTYVCPPSSTRDRMKNGVDGSSSFGRSVTAAAHVVRVRGRAGN